MLAKSTTLSLSNEQVGRIAQDFQPHKTTDIGSAIIHRGQHPVLGLCLFISTPEGNGALIIEERHASIAEHFLE